MKLRLIRIQLILPLALAGTLSMSFEQETTAYSSKDDAEAARTYASIAGHNQNAAGLYKSATDLLRRQKYARAQALLDEMLKLDPRCADAYATYAYCQIWQEQYTQAIETLSKAINIDGNKPLYFYRRALSMFSTERIDDAINEVTRAIQLKPDDAESLRLRARCYEHTMNGVNNAIADLTKLIELKSFAVDSLIERAELYIKTDQDDKAMVDLQRAIEVDANSGEAYRCMADIFYKQKKYALAAENYSAAIVNGSNKLDFCRIQRETSLRYLKNREKREASEQNSRDKKLR